MNRFRLTATAALALASGFAHAQCGNPTGIIAPLDRTSFDLFGTALGVADNVVVIGSPWDDNVRGQNAGSAYVYQRINGVWVQKSHLIPADGGPEQNFGRFVATDSSAVVVGVPGQGAGAAYFYGVVGAGQFSQLNRVTAPGSGTGFGSGVGVHYGIGVVGAPYSAIGGDAQAGAAYAYRYYSILGEYIPLTNALTETDPAIRTPSAWYGFAVDTFAESIAVGVPYGDLAGNPSAHPGYVALWQRNGDGATFRQRLIAPGVQDGDHFGKAVDLGYSYLAVGAPDADTLGVSDAGAVYIFRYNGASYVYEDKLIPEAMVAGDKFGSKVSMAHGRVVITSPGRRQVYLFRRLPSGVWVQDARFQDPVGGGDSFAAAAGIDQYGNIVIGDSGDDVGGTDSGIAYAYELPLSGSDECAGATPVTQGATYGCTATATAGFTPAPCGNSTGGFGPDLWYAYTAPCSGSVTIDTQGSSFDTVLVAYSGCTGAGAVLACNDDFAQPERWSRITLGVTQGTTSYLRVAGYNGASGSLTFNVGPCTAGCYANCDGSVGAPSLNVNDFVCFQQRFAAADPYADCNQDAAFNVNDFVCFQAAFAAGCR